jgi:hypothetical protein
MLTKQETTGKRRSSGELQGKGTQENSSAKWLTVSSFMVMELVYGLSLANHSGSESFLVVHTLFSQDGCQREGFWEVVRHVMCPLTFPRLFWLVCVSSVFLTKISYCKTTYANGYYGVLPGRAVSVSVLPPTETLPNCGFLFKPESLLWPGWRRGAVPGL